VSAYQNRTALVLGGMGFIGSHLTDRLLSAGARVTVVTRSLDRHRDEAVVLHERGVKVVEGDIRNADAMRAVVANQSVIFNLAGESGAVQSMEDPYTDLDVNGRGNLVLLEALRASNRNARLVFVGSRLEYGRVGDQPVHEDQTPDPLCIHAVHKLAVEHYLRIYGRLFGLNYTIARLTNPYGPGQPQSRTAYGVVNRLIHLALADHDLPIYGDGAQKRDYIYIDDAVKALLGLAASQVAAGKAYNVGTGTGTSLIEMARAIAQMAGAGRIRHLAWPRLAEQIETGDFIADISRIRSDIGWEPAVALRDGLQRTIAFYRAHVAS
jgi:nucleoside-diphosphate-sugar epimerase